MSDLKRLESGCHVSRKGSIMRKLRRFFVRQSDEDDADEFLQYGEGDDVCGVANSPVVKKYIQYRVAMPVKDAGHKSRHAFGLLQQRK